MDEILSAYPAGQREYLLCVLQDIQEEWGYLSEESIIKSSQYFNIPTVSVYGAASFYSQFRFTPKGRHHIKICKGSACHLMGNETLLKHLERKLRIHAGETTRNGLYSIEVVDCMGACHLAPLMSINSVFYPRLSEGKLNEIIDTINNNSD